jgi:hypothetical protein
LLYPRFCTVRDTSFIQWQRIRPTLSARERAVYLGLCDDAGPAGLTGGELAAAMGIPVTSVRPRLCGLKRKGWIAEFPARKSRAQGEGVCHPYVPAVPREAVERVK